VWKQSYNACRIRTVLYSIDIGSVSVSTVQTDDTSDETEVSASDSVWLILCASRIVCITAMSKLGVVKASMPSFPICIVFTALHGMQTQSCDEMSVCPSVRPSVKRVHCDKTEEKSVQIFIPCERSFCLVL